MGVDRAFVDVTEGRRKFMRKGIASILTALCLMGLAGCAGGEKNVGTKETADTPTLVAEDLKQGNDTIFNMGKGYYYYSKTQHGFRYADSATGNDLYLCNKPECRHDGNEFCVATNGKYGINHVGMYGGRIFATAIEATDTQFKFHLLSIALDGSVLNEEVTYLTLENSGMLPALHVDKTQLYIHRNVALIPVWLVGSDETGLVQSYGTAVVNLDTKEVTYLDEEPFSPENQEIAEITAYGDYFYYCRAEKKKTTLYRYNIKDGTEEEHKLMVGFKGNYAVLDENTIVYTKSSNEVLCVYHRETGENEEKVNLKRWKKWYFNGVADEDEEAYDAADIKTDGEYLYVMESGRTILHIDGDINVTENLHETGTSEEAYVHVFDKEWNEVTAVDMAEVMAFATEVRTETQELYLKYNRMMYFEKDKVFCVLPNANNTEESYVYVCKREDFLSGNPQFELAYKREK